MVTFINTPDKNPVKSNENVTLHVIACSLHETSFHNTYNFKSSSTKIDTGISKPTWSYKHMWECNWQIHPMGYTRAFHYMKSNILITEIK